MPPKRSRKSIPHGVGWNALIAAVILLAVRDATTATKPHQRADARLFLQSSACDGLLDSLNLPSNTTLLALIDDGLDPTLSQQLGKFNSDEGNPATVRARERRKRERKKAKQKKSLAVQPLLLVF